MIYPMYDIKNYIVQPWQWYTPYGLLYTGTSYLDPIQGKWSWWYVMHYIQYSQGITYSEHSLVHCILSSHTVFGTYTFIYTEPGVSVQRWKSHPACQKLVKYWPFPIGPTAASSSSSSSFRPRSHTRGHHRACIFIALLSVFVWVCACVCVPKNLTSIFHLCRCIYSYLYTNIYL